MIYDGTGSVAGGTGWYLVVLDQYRAVWVDNYDIYWVSMKQICLIHRCTGSVDGSTGQYLVMLGQYEALLVGTWWYWVSIS